MATWQTLRRLRHRDLLLGSLLRVFERDQLEIETHKYGFGLW